MKLEYFFSKDGERTFSVDSVFLHSKYSPLKEAERFAGTIQPEFPPQVIILVEPGLSYLYDFLKARFPDSKIGCIRIIKELDEKKQKWDFCIAYDEDLFYFFTGLLGERLLFNSLLISWQPAAVLFRAQTEEIWHTYKRAMEHCRTILVTRQYFEKKWLVNSFNFVKYVHFPMTLKKKPDVPIVIAASGPSLKTALPVLKKYRSKFLLIGVSSALQPLLYHGCRPDLALSTDGGFWAEKHLQALEKQKIPLALPPEAYASKKMLGKAPVVIMGYEDGLSRRLMDHCAVKFRQIKRNGTVTGSALELAKELTDREIFLAGLDMKNQKGFQHTQPNKNELINAALDTRINSKATRLSRSELSEGQLELYRKWFEAQPSRQGIFRIIDDKENQSLGSIRDISSIELEKRLCALKDERQDFFEEGTPGIPPKKERLEGLKDFVHRNAGSAEWMEQLFPADTIAIMHAKSEEERHSLTEMLHKKSRELTETLLDITDDKL